MMELRHVFALFKASARSSRTNGPDQQQKVLEQLAAHSLALRTRPFDKGGSIVFESGGNSLDIGPYAMWQLWKTPLQGLGPYNTTGEAYRHIIQMYLELCRTGELDNLAIDNALAFDWRLKFLEAWSLTRTPQTSQFYLKHQDDKGDHMLVNDDFEITGIICWESATLKPAEFAFSSPLMLWPVGDFYDGKNVLSSHEFCLAQIFDEGGHDDMRAFIMHGRLYQRFHFYLGGGSEARGDFIGLFKGLRRAAAALPDDSTDVGREADAADYEGWKWMAIEKADPRLRDIIDLIWQRQHDIRLRPCEFEP